MTNRVLLEKALALLPDVQETRIRPARSVQAERPEDGKRSVCVKDAGPWQDQPLKKGARILLDFADHQVGYLTLDLVSAGSHADAPVWLRLHFAENVVELFEKAEDYHGWVCASWIETEQIHLDVVPSVVTLPRRYAFRYVLIEIIDISSKFDLVLKDAVCTSVSSADDGKLTPLHSENVLHTRLDQVACRTLHNCMQRVFEDGPKRDRRLWMGDLRIQAKTNYLTYQNNDMVKGCLYLLAALPQADGRVSAGIFLEPEPEADDVVMFDYSLLFIHTLHEYFEATGDMETLLELWPVALSQIYLAEEQLGPQGVICDSDQMGWCFIDWNLELNKQAAAHGVFLSAIREAVRIAQRLEDGESLKRLRALYDECRQAALDVFWDDTLQYFVSGPDRQISIASQVWMVLGGVLEGEQAYALLKRVKADPLAVGMVSPYMVHYFIEALILTGNVPEAICQMTDFWGGMLKEGADTFWELYDPLHPDASPYGGTVVNSYCHAWSCGPAYFLRKYCQPDQTTERKRGSSI